MTDATIGHNSKAAKMAFVARLERLEDDKRALAEDIKELKQEVKRAEFDPKEITRLAKLRHKGQDDAKLALDTHENDMATLGWLG